MECVAVATAQNVSHILCKRYRDTILALVHFLRCARIKAVESAPTGVSNEEVLGIRFRWGATAMTSHGAVRTKRLITGDVFELQPFLSRTWWTQVFTSVHCQSNEFIDQSASVMDLSTVQL